MTTAPLILDVRNHAEFQQLVFNKAANSCKRYHRFGLTHLVQTDAQYAAETRDSTTGNSQAKPTNIRPDDLAGTATTAVRAEHTEKLNQYEKVEDVTSEIHTFILSLMSPADICAISDPITSTRRLSCLNIMELMAVKYNTLDAMVLKSLKDSLKQPIGSMESLDTLVSTHIMTYAKLDDAGEEFSTMAYEKFTNLVEALATRAEYIDVIKSYKTLTPAPINQTFDSFVTYLRAQAPNIQRTAAAVGYGNPTPAQANSAVSTQLASLQAEVLRLSVELVAAKKSGKSGGGVKRTQQADCYCWVHGTVKFYSHDGVGGLACNAMKGVHASKYTDAQRAAKSANDIPGATGCTKVYGK